MSNTVITVKQVQKPSKKFKFVDIVSKLCIKKNLELGNAFLNAAKGEFQKDRVQL